MHEEVYEVLRNENSREITFRTHSARLQGMQEVLFADVQAQATHACAHRRETI